MTKTFNIGFSHWVNNEWVDDETQFDAGGNDLNEMMTDLLYLWTEFYYENHLNHPEINYVEETKKD